MSYFQIAIDGPSGAGKSTVARKLARDLGFSYLDTGAMYRSLALKIQTQGINPNDELAVQQCLDTMSLSFQPSQEEICILLDGKEITEQIRTKEISSLASKVSVLPAVRKAMQTLQRNLAKSQNSVLDGRDIGTVVLPDASLKIYLTANLNARANRRFLQNTSQEEPKSCSEHSYQEILEAMDLRDQRDLNRSLDPLKKADDAVVIDSSDLDVESVCDQIKKLFWERYKSQNL